MKILISIFILVIILAFPLNSQEVEVYIKGVLKSEVTSLKYNSELKYGEPFKVSFEILNSGSLDYRARVRLDVLNGDDLFYAGWSKEIPLWPGQSRYYELYFYPVNMTGNFTGKIRIYHANEIKELEPVQFKIESMITPEKNIQLTGIKTYEDRIEVGLRSDQELNNVIIIPSDYPMGWIFEQSKIDEIRKGEEKKVELRYEPTIWKPTEVVIHVFTEDGKQHTSESFLMERENPVSIISYFIKILRIFSISPFF